MQASASAKRDPVSGEADKAEIRSVEEVVSKLVLAVKKTNLYPENHAVSREAIEELTLSLEEFTEHFGDLVLEVLGEGFRYKDHHLGAVAGSSDIAYRCYRDGVEWLTFAQGTEKNELKIFVDILNAHQIIGDEDEGDIVTSLWEAGLTRILYYTGQAVWCDEPMLDLNKFRVLGRSLEGGSFSGSAESVPESRSFLERTGERHLWQLTQEELEATRRMVQEEENRDFTGDVFDVLLVILEQQRNEEDVTNALDIIQEGMVKALAKGHFRNTCRFLNQFHRIRRKYIEEGHWVLDHLEDFLVAISGSRVLSSLRSYMNRAQENEPEELEYLRKTLIQLLPESIEALGAMLPSVHSRAVGEELRSAIRELAEIDVRPLVRLARSEDERIARQAIAVLSRMPAEGVGSHLLEVTRSSDSSVRRFAVEALTRQGHSDYTDFLDFLADQDAEIRRLVFRFFSSSRSPEKETKVVEYIRKGDFKQRDASFLLSLYRVLGSCGSKRSKDFLGDRLFTEPGRMWGMRALHRRGAAMALALLEDEEAQALLRKASRSLWPSLRRAVRKAREYDHAVG